MRLSPPQTKALGNLTDRWQTARKLHAHTRTMDYLVTHGCADRRAIDGFNTFKVVKYRRSRLLWSEERVLGILVTQWPHWTWGCKQESLIFAIKVSVMVGIDTVLYGHNMDAADLTDDDVIAAGRVAVAGLRSALQRYERGV